ncbi:MAG: SRPBCC family protein [Gammaproteobacteria bacterium]|nr:SRPBCC family protein [Gammaproteobacteria bacterium]
MEFKHSFDIPADRDTLWDILMDVHQVAACIDGVESLQVVDPDHFEGRLGVKMGPVRLAFNGTVEVIRRDRDNWSAAFVASANDRKAGGGFTAELAMQLDTTATAERTSNLDVTLSTSLTGRIGQLGRPLIKKRVETMLQDFASALTAHVETRTQGVNR